MCTYLGEVDVAPFSLRVDGCMSKKMVSVHLLTCMHESTDGACTCAKSV